MGLSEMQLKTGKLRGQRDDHDEYNRHLHNGVWRGKEVV